MEQSSLSDVGGALLIRLVSTGFVWSPKPNRLIRHQRNEGIAIYCLLAQPRGDHC